MRKQKGMTLIGMLLTAAVVVISAVVIMRIVPVYIEHYTIIQSVKALSSIPASSLTGVPDSDARELKKSLDKRLDVNGVQELKEEELTITSTGINKYAVRVKYQVIRHLVYNLNLLFDFDDTIEVTTGSEEY